MVGRRSTGVSRVGQPRGSSGAARVLRVRHPCPRGDPAGEHRGHRADACRAAGHRASRDPRRTRAGRGARAVSERSTASTEDFMTRHSLATSAFLITAALSWPSVTTAQGFKAAKFSIGGDGGTDYLTAEPGTGRVFVSRATHVMVLDGATGKVVGDIPDTPRTHGIALAPKSGRGFITSAGDSTVTMFDLKTLAVIKKIPVATGGLDGIMYEDFSDRIILTNHSRPIGTVVAINPTSGDV